MDSALKLWGGILPAGVRDLLRALAVEVDRLTVEVETLKEKANG